MKKMLLSAAALFVAIVGPAAAADLSPRSDYVAPPMSVQADEWAGFFAGVHGGYAWANRAGCWTLTSTPLADCSSPGGTFNYNQAGWLAGAQAGYNWKPTQHFLLGVQVDGSLADITGSFSGFAGGVGTWNSLGTATA